MRERESQRVSQRESQPVSQRGSPFFPLFTRSSWTPEYWHSFYTSPPTITLRPTDGRLVRCCVTPSSLSLAIVRPPLLLLFPVGLFQVELRVCDFLFSLHSFFTRYRGHVHDCIVCLCVLRVMGSVKAWIFSLF